MKRFPFFNWPNHHTPIVQSSLSAALNVDSPTALFSESFSKNWFCCTGRIIPLHLFKKTKTQNPTFLKHQFGHQNCRCGTYHSVKALACGHLKILQFYAEICLQWWRGACVHLKYSLQKKKIKNKNKRNTVYILMGYPQGLHKIQKALFRWVSDSLFALILDAIWSPWRKTIFMVTIFVRPEWG